MNYKIVQYEIKQNKKNAWEIISEATALKLLHDSSSKITPIIDEMLQGKEVIIPKGILRIKKMRE